MITHISKKYYPLDLIHNTAYSNPHINQ